MTRPRQKPSRKLARRHSSAVLTPRHIERMKAGRVESLPAEYRDRLIDPDVRRQTEARRVLEDRRLMRELGLPDL